MKKVIVTIVIIVFAIIAVAAAGPLYVIDEG
jgi:hypothetical protein